MNHVVLPLSACPQGRGGFSVFLFLNGVTGHALLVGLPIALCVRRSAGPPPAEGPPPSARTRA